MELKEFLEKFLPDYEEKAKAACEPIRANFVSINFPEALQNFADKICEVQRTICADVYQIDNPVCSTHYVCNGILDAEQPNIDEL